MTTTMKRPGGTRRGAQGWVPNQHGAWAMVVVPWLLGFVLVVRGGAEAAPGLLLLAFWVVGYFAFFASSQWLRSRFKRRYFPAVRTYALAAGALGIALLSLRPQWWSWVFVLAPLAGMALWLAWRRRDRSLTSGMTTVAAASLLPAVLGSDGVWPWTVPPVLVGVGAVCFGYFFGTVLYVKTVIRERGRVGWVVSSLAWHAACAAGSLLLPAPLPRTLLATFFALMAARALLVPALGPLRGRAVSAKTVGIGEFVASGALVAIILLQLG